MTINVKELNIGVIVMKTRNLFLVDPLPNIALLVRKSLTSMNDKNFTIVIQEPPRSIEGLMAAIQAKLGNNEDVGLLAPFNEAINADLLTQFKSVSKNTVNSSDLLDSILEQFYKVNPRYQLPVIIPFLSIYSPEKIQSLLSEKKHIKFSVACMSKHIIGALDDNLDKASVNKVFYRHFNTPIKGVNLMKDLV
jgi:hypothetical protein